MAWPGKKEEELPEVLRGKSPEEIAKIVGDAAGLQTKITEQQTSLQTLNTQFENLKAKQIELERNASVQNNNNSQNNNGGGGAKELTKWSEDADTAFAERVEAAIAPLRNATMATSAQTARMAAERHIMSNPLHAKLLQKYTTEVEEAIKKTMPAYLTIPQTYVSIFEMVIGRHVGELLDMAAKKEGGLFAETGGDAGGSFGSGNKGAQEVTLNDEDRAYIKKSGVSEEAFLRSKKRLIPVGA